MRSYTFARLLSLAAVVCVVLAGVSQVWHGVDVALSWLAVGVVLGGVGWFEAVDTARHNLAVRDRRRIPERGFLRLDPTLDLDTLDLTPSQRAIAAALQTDGAYVGDEDLLRNFPKGWQLYA